MAERDVTLKVSAKAAPGAGAPFAKLAKDVDAAKIAADKLDSGFRKVAAGVAGIGSIAVSTDKDVKKLLETFIAFRSVVDIFEGIKAAVIGASAAVRGFGAVAGAAGAGGAGGKGIGVGGAAAAGAAGGAGTAAVGAISGLGAGLIGAGLLGIGAELGAIFFPDQAVGAIRAVGGFPSLTAGEKATGRREAQLKFITEQRERIEEGAKRIFELQEKLNGAIKEETKLRIDALQKQREQLKEQQQAATEFGLLSPLEQVNARRVARALSEGRGGGLTAEELRFGGGLSALRPAVEQFTQQRAQASPIFQEILRLRPQRPEDLIQRDIDALEQRAREGERAVQAQVNQAIQVDISQNPESLATQIARTLLPQLVELNQKTVESLQKQLADALGNIRAGSRATFGIAKSQ